MLLYWINLVCSTSLFLLTVTVRNRIIYSLINDVNITNRMLSIFNVVMVFSLLILIVSSIYLGIKVNKLYYWIAFLGAGMLIISLIGIFLFPKGGVLS
jgi:hypothetical protein